MNWLKRFFCKDSQEDIGQLRPSEVNLNISEPVISFLKVFEGNPRRFKIKGTTTSACDAHRGYKAYKLRDMITKEEFTFLKRWFATGERDTYGIRDLPDFLTVDEQELIINTVRNYYVERGIRLRELKQIRTKRKHNNERKRLTKIYQGVK